MVEENLQALELLLEREEAMMHQLSALQPGAEMEALLNKLAESLQHFQRSLVQLGATDLSSADKSTLGRLQDLKQKRDQNAALLQKILQSNDDKLAVLQVEKKALNKYRPAGPKEPRLLDYER